MIGKDFFGSYMSLFLGEKCISDLVSLKRRLSIVAKIGGGGGERSKVTMIQTFIVAFFPSRFVSIFLGALLSCRLYSNSRHALSKTQPVRYARRKLRGNIATSVRVRSRLWWCDRSLGSFRLQSVTKRCFTPEESRGHGAIATSLIDALRLCLCRCRLTYLWMNWDTFVTVGRKPSAGAWTDECATYSAVLLLCLVNETSCHI